MTSVSLSGVTKDYRDAAAVKGVNLDVTAGDFLCLLGPSGCGKTTILRMIAGLEPQTQGQIRIRDQLVADPAAGLFIAPEKRNLGLVFQNYALWPHLSVEQNVAFGLKLRRLTSAQRQENVSEALNAMEIADLAKRFPHQLSGGQQQRVAIARTLAVEPQVLLMDEPLSNLDARLRLEMRAVLKRLHARLGTTIIFVTHDQWEAMTLASRIAVMKAGQIEQIGSPDDIYDRPSSRFVAEFVGTPPINLINLRTKTPIARALTNHTHSKATYAGLRPETCRLGPVAPASAFSVTAEVHDILPTGGAWIIELCCHGDTVFALSHIRPIVRQGDHITLSASLDAPHFFDDAGLSCAALTHH